MKTFLSLDIETSGLNPDTCQILEIGAVFDDGISPVADLPRFQTFVWNAPIQGEPYGLAMNARCLAAIAKGGAAHDFETQKNHQWAGAVMRPGAVAEQMLRWFHEFLGNKDDPFWEPNRITIAGKNVGSFDWQFLKRHTTLPKEWFDHRFLDVGPLFLRPADISIPGQSKCLQRAGLPHEVTHCRT